MCADFLRLIERLFEARAGKDAQGQRMAAEEFAVAFEPGAQVGEAADGKQVRAFRLGEQEKLQRAGGGGVFVGDPREREPAGEDE